jgi:hypothetical protein
VRQRDRNSLDMIDFTYARTQHGLATSWRFRNLFQRKGGAEDEEVFSMKVL